MLGYDFVFDVNFAPSLLPFPLPVPISLLLLSLLITMVMNRIIWFLILLARSKLVLDFALTVLGIHLLFTSLYTRSVPSNRLWWGVQVVSAGVMVVGGMWACRWRELRPIGFGGGAGGRGGKKGGGGGGGVGDERGGYEMVGKGEEEGERNGDGGGG